MTAAALLLDLRACMLLRVTSGPPRFLFGEMVRIVEATGRELRQDDLGDDQPIDVRPLIGEEVPVNGPTPTSDHQAWMCLVWVPSLQAMLEVPEEILASTRRFDIRADGEPILPRPWRDDVFIYISTLTHDVDEAESITRAAVARLETLDDVREVDWRVDEPSDHSPASVAIWVWSHGDALQMFARVIAQAPDGWKESDDSTYVGSYWDSRDSTGQFLAPGVATADVAYRRWSSPIRRSRAEIDTTGT